MFPDLELNAALQRCLRRIRGWQPPSNWSAEDWHREITAHALCAVCEAERDFDPSRGVPLGGFVYQRVLARSLTRYRQEWSYARRHAPAPANSEGDEGPPRDGPAAPPEPAASGRAELLGALAGLSTLDRAIIVQTYWHDRTETEVARDIGISQQAVNKRKRLALEKLGLALGEPGKTSGPGS